MHGNLKIHAQIHLFVFYQQQQQKKNHKIADDVTYMLAH